MVEDPRDFVNENDRSLAFLPWAHSYGQTCELWLGIHKQIERAFEIRLSELGLNVDGPD